MTTAFMTPAARVEIVQRKHRLEARHPASGRLLGTAVRSTRNDDEWIGWLVRCGEHMSVQDTVTAARELLETLAGAVE